MELLLNYYNPASLVVSQTTVSPVSQRLSALCLLLRISEKFAHVRQLLHSSCNNLLPFSTLHNGDSLLDVKLLRANFCTNHLLEKKENDAKTTLNTLRDEGVACRQAEKSVNLSDCQ